MDQRKCAIAEEQPRGRGVATRTAFLPLHFLLSIVKPHEHETPGTEQEAERGRAEAPPLKEYVYQDF